MIRKISPIRISDARHCVLLSVLVFCFTASAANAADIYVDNLLGDDVFDGLSQRPLGVTSGPVKSIGRAVRLVGRGDVIHVANTGVPYYESVDLVGDRNSGFPLTPLVVEGNGAVLDGARTLPPEAWKQVAADVWKFTPTRKGSYALYLDGKPVQEHRIPSGAKILPQIPEGRWSAWRGSVYYHTKPLEDPADRQFAFAYDGVGLSLYRVEHAVIRNLTLRRYRLDGVNAHDFCRNVIFENVTSVENGRSGVATGGTSQISLRGCTIQANGRHSVLIQELSSLDVVESKLSEEPTLAE